jgi:hypothetical protein
MPIAEDSKKRLVVRHPGTGRLIWASRLPFGYLEAPRLFCALTEAVIERLRKRAAGKDIHFYVFVDDVLVVGGSEELTREGCRLLEEEFAERGIQWAPHKKRGPCECIEFLGLLICNMEGVRGVTITRKRLAKLLAEMEGWSARAPAGVGELEVDPTELASLLGKLVFASQVVRGGRVYMQGMLSAFKGLVVDWRRGAVAPVGGKWGAMSVGEAFWRDLRWWRMHLEQRSLTPFDTVPMGEGVLSGTDASGWGTGQILWLDGGREEHRLRFTAAEKRRPINWRELLGIWRICAMGGERLRGKVLLVETDNMSAKDATRKLASKAADMQELIRRIYRLAERHGFQLRVTHTPGVKLDRPDQTSRGDATEEPRMRLRVGEWDQVVGRWGPFDGLIGAEREHGQPVREVGREDTRLWSHPTLATVGSALRRIGERLAAVSARGIRAVAMVPDDSSAQWQTLLKYGRVVGRWDEGEEVLETNVLGRWLPSTARRPTLLVVFPRAAGSVARRLMLTTRESMEPVTLDAGSDTERVTTAGEGYVERADGLGMRLWVAPGSLVYSMAADPNMRGCLYRVVQPSELEAGADPDVLVAQEVLLDSSRQARKSVVPVFMVADSDQHWRPDPAQLWTVDHHVEALPAGARSRKYRFDYRAANAEIQRRGLQQQGTSGWVMLSPEPSMPPAPVDGVDTGYSPFELGEAAGEERSDDLAEVAAGLRSLHLEQHVGKSGPEGRVPAVAWEARGGERMGEVGEVVQRCQYRGIQCAGCQQFFELGEPMLSHGTSLVHPAQACQEAHDAQVALEVAQGQEHGRSAAETAFFYGVFTTGREASGVYESWSEVSALIARAAAHGEELDWSTFSLRESAVSFVEAATRKAAEASAATASAGPVQGVPVTWFKCVRDDCPCEASYNGQADEFCCFTCRQGDPCEANYHQLPAQVRSVSGPTPFQKGSTTRQTHLAEKLSEGRLQMIRDCIEERCGFDHSDGSATECRGGCGVRLHVATCAQLGKGFAALGNFTCAACRLRSSLARAGEVLSRGDVLARASPDLLSVAERTMVLELSQGKEGTAAGYAEYTRLEEEYARGMGLVLDGELILPRHSEEAFKNFCTWFALDAERSRSLESTVRTAGSFLTKLQLPDVTKHGSVKAHVRDLISEIGIAHEPATTATPRMLKLMVEEVVRGRFNDSFIRAREIVQLEIEGIGGCRIGEVAGGGDCHGVLANNTCVLTNQSAEPGSLAHRVVEIELEHSKTGFSRFLDYAGVTQNSQIEAANHMLSYWAAAGFKVVTTVQAGVMVQRPDFWVLRVSLLGMDEGGLERLLTWAATCRIKQIEYGISKLQTGSKARQRYGARGASSQEKKYYNLMGGASDCAAMQRGLQLLHRQGFEARIVPGPLLLSTTGGIYPKVTSMPLAVSSAFGPTKELLQKAYVKANLDPRNPDPDLDLRAGEEPKWSTHSLRRLADTTARRYRSETGTTADMIDLYFGWQERILKKAMQVHYASLSIIERMRQAWITGMM